MKTRMQRLRGVWLVMVALGLALANEAGAQLRPLNSGNGSGGSLNVTSTVAGVFPIRIASGTNITLDVPPTNRVMVMSSVASQMTNAFKRYYFDTNVAPSLSNLVAAASSGDVVELGAGDFRIGTQTIRVPVGVTLKGQGMGRTFISGDVGVPTNVIVQIMSTNTLEDFTIIANKPSYFQYPIGNNMIFGHPAATNALIRRVQIFGETDALLIGQSNRVSVTLEQVDFRSAWDVCNLIDLDTGDGVPGITATIIDSQLYSDSDTATNPQALLDPKSQPLIVSGAILDLINCVVTATNHKAITLSMQGFETNLVFVTDTIFRSAGTNGYGKQIDILTDSDVSVSKAFVSSQRIQDSDINGSSGVTYLPAQIGSLRASTFRSLDDIFATDGLFSRTATITNELQAATVNTTDLNATGASVLADAVVSGTFIFTDGNEALGKVLGDTDGAGTIGWVADAGGSGGGTNFTLFNTRQAIITNTLDRLTVTYSANTNIVWDWNATNVVTVSPSNTFTVSQTGTPPSTMLRTGRLRIINTNSTAGYFFGTGPGGSEVTLLTAPSTNDYTISSFNGVVEIVSHQVSEIGTNAYMRTRTGVRRTIIIDASYILTNGLTQGAIPTTYVSPYSSSNAMANSALYFDTDATNATFSLTLPPEYDRNDITLAPVWAATNGSGNVVFQFATTYAENNETFNVAYGANANSTDALTPTDGYHIGPSVTPTYGNPASTPLGNVQVRLRRTRDHASDTLDAGVFLLRVLLQYTESTTEPSALP